MSDRCPHDGGFIGKSGCTHPNHQHSELVKRLISFKQPNLITPDECEQALREGFYVKNPNGKNVGFGENLLSHIDNDPVHAPQDAQNRKARLQFAITAVTHPDKMDVNHRGIPGRTSYAKAFPEFGMLVITGPETDTVDKVYTFFPRRGGKKRT